MIISHTAHYYQNGAVVGWGPTIREINHLTEIFDEIYHIAPLHKGEEAPNSSLPYISTAIKFIPLKPYGGSGLKDKLKVLTTAPFNLGQIKRILPEVDWIQFRAPTSMGLYIIPYLSFSKKPLKWFKYAGNWNEENLRFTYALQKWWLNNNLQNAKVTINGRWPNQPKHILSFTNPCLNQEEYLEGQEIAKQKEFQGSLHLTFAGQLTEAKGVDVLLNALKDVDSVNIKELTLIGDGPERSRFEKEARKLKIKVNFTGFLKRDELSHFYKISHLFILPSKTEGFPKVVAEAAAYGCVPFVTDISSIGQYIKHLESGYLLKNRTAGELAENLNHAFNHRENLKEFSENAMQIAEHFTFNYYNQQLLERVLSRE